MFHFSSSFCLLLLRLSLLRFHWVVSCDFLYSTNPLSLRKSNAFAPTSNFIWTLYKQKHFPKNNLIFNTQLWDGIFCNRSPTVIYLSKYFQRHPNYRVESVLYFVGDINAKLLHLQQLLNDTSSRFLTFIKSNSCAPALPSNFHSFKLIVNFIHALQTIHSFSISSSRFHLPTVSPTRMESSLTTSRR